MEELLKSRRMDRRAGAQAEAYSTETIPGFFARGINYYKCFWIFFFTAFIGCIVETVFMLLAHSVLQNRSGVLYGSFSLVWGAGAVFLTLCFQRLSARHWAWTFLAGTLLGAGYEYACSWLQEVLFGARFWDYSHLPLNINGRVNLVFCLFWGAAAVIWVRWLYPGVCRLIAYIPNRAGKPLTVAFTLLMACNIAVTAAALVRMDQRQRDIPAQGTAAVFLDQHYTDQRLERIFSSMKYTGTDEAREAVGVPKPNDLPVW